MTCAPRLSVHSLSFNPKGDASVPTTHPHLSRPYAACYPIQSRLTLSKNFPNNMLVNCCTLSKRFSLTESGKPYVSPLSPEMKHPLELPKWVTGEALHV